MYLNWHWPPPGAGAQQNHVLLKECLNGECYEKNARNHRKVLVYIVCSKKHPCPRPFLSLLAAHMNLEPIGPVQLDPHITKDAPFQETANQHDSILQTPHAGQSRFTGSSQYKHFMLAISSHTDTRVINLQNPLTSTISLQFFQIPLMQMAPSLPFLWTNIHSQRSKRIPQSSPTESWRRLWLPISHTSDYTTRPGREENLVNDSPAEGGVMKRRHLVVQNQTMQSRDFPGGSVVKNQSSKAREDPWVNKIPHAAQQLSLCMKQRPSTAKENERERETMGSWTTYCQQMLLLLLMAKVPEAVKSFVV